MYIYIKCTVGYSIFTNLNCKGSNLKHIVINRNELGNKFIFSEEFYIQLTCFLFCVCCFLYKQKVVFALNNMHCIQDRI